MRIPCRMFHGNTGCASTPTTDPPGNCDSPCGESNGGYVLQRKCQHAVRRGPDLPGGALLQPLHPAAGGGGAARRGHRARSCAELPITAAAVARLVSRCRGAGTMVRARSRLSPGCGKTSRERPCRPPLGSADYLGGDAGRVGRDRSGGGTATKPALGRNKDWSVRDHPPAGPRWNGGGVSGP